MRLNSQLPGKGDWNLLFKKTILFCCKHLDKFVYYDRKPRHDMLKTSQIIEHLAISFKERLNILETIE